MAIIDSSNAYGLGIGVLSAILITQISNQLHRSKFIYPKNVINSNNDYYYWRYRNFLISFVHASITGLGSMIVTMNSPSLLIEVLDKYNEFGYLLTSFSFGYFIYDTMEMLTHKEYKGTKELVFHHILILACFSNTIFCKRYVGFNMIALLIEISNVFLHFRQLLLLSNHPKTTALYYWNSLVNIAFFVLVRLGCMFWLWYTLVINLEKIPILTKVIALVSMSGISVTTVILFYRVINADFIDDRRRSRRGDMTHSPSSPSLYSEDDDQIKKSCSMLNGNRHAADNQNGGTNGTSNRVTNGLSSSIASEIADKKVD